MRRLSRAIASQLGRPSGALGRATAYALRRANRGINDGAVERLGVAAQDRVLEIGFGGGEGLADILRRTDGPVAGIEISETMLRHATRRFRAEIRAGKLDLKLGDVSDTGYEDAAFDRVLSVNTIYFWPDPLAGLGEIRRVLRQGGRVLLATETKEDMQKSALTRHGFRLFHDHELDALLRQAGFAEVAIEREGICVFSSGRA
jgi:SAM-dependent methyltransferase